MTSIIHHSYGERSFRPVPISMGKVTEEIEDIQKELNWFKSKNFLMVIDIFLSNKSEEVKSNVVYELLVDEIQHLIVSLF